MSAAVVAAVLVVPGVRSPAAEPTTVPAGATTAPGADGPFRVTATYAVGGRGGWDLPVFDQAANRLLVPRGGRVDVFDPDAGKVVASLGHNHINHAIALAEPAGRGFVSNSGDDSIVAFDLKTPDQRLAHFPIGDKPDDLTFDPATGKVFVCDAVGHDIAAFDAKAEMAGDCKVAVERCDLEAPPEGIVADGAGNLYVNQLNVDKVAVIDGKTMKLTAEWPIAPGSQATGLAFDLKTGHLFVGCTSGHLVVLDTAHGGAVVDALPIAKGCDGVAFDPELKLVLLSCNSGFLEVVGPATAADHYRLVQHLATRFGARTLALDAVRHVVYLPTAEFDLIDPPEQSRWRPNTFMILKVERTAK